MADGSSAKNFVPTTVIIVESHIHNPYHGNNPSTFSKSAYHVFQNTRTFKGHVMVKMIGRIIKEAVS